MTPRVALVLVAAACGPRPTVAPPAAEDRIAIVASETGPHGARLVAIDERGDRQFDVVVAPVAIARDANPTISPDGRWIVFASTRDRALHETSLWIARLGVEAAPQRLTHGTAIDSHPTWRPDGRALVFASTREGGDFDLWQLAIERGRATGDPVQLTHGPGHEVTPTIAGDGTIAYTAVRQTGAREIESHLEERTPDGRVRAVTAGPADNSPAFSPDGATIAFARPQVQNGTPDSELWRMTRGSEVATKLVDLPMTDESGPVWSRDGRFVFATSVLRGADGKALFSSVVHVDLRESPGRARMLADRTGAIARLTPAIAVTSLDAPALRADPEYLPELARIMAAAIAKHQVEESSDQ